MTVKKNLAQFWFGLLYSADSYCYWSIKTRTNKTNEVSFCYIHVYTNGNLYLYKIDVDFPSLSVRLGILL